MFGSERLLLAWLRARAWLEDSDIRIYGPLVRPFLRIDDKALLRAGHKIGRELFIELITGSRNERNVYCLPVSLQKRIHAWKWALHPS